MKPIKLNEFKKCNTCGKIHAEIPPIHIAETRPDYFVGYYWNCECGSTMYAPLGKIVRAA